MHLCLAAATAAKKGQRDKRKESWWKKGRQAQCKNEVLFCRQKSRAKFRGFLYSLLHTNLRSARRKWPSLASRWLLD